MAAAYFQSARAAGRLAPAECLVIIRRCRQWQFNAAPVLDGCGKTVTGRMAEIEMKNLRLRTER